MVVIRLSRVGKKNSPSYRVVVADKQRAVKRKFIEVIGHYNPTLNPKELVINKERALFWLENGAQASDTVNNLMVDLGILKKDQKMKKIYGKPNKKKATPEEKSAPTDAGNNVEEATEEALESTEKPTEEENTAPQEEAAVEQPAESEDK